MSSSDHSTSDLVASICDDVASRTGDLETLVRESVDRLAPLADPHRHSEIVVSALSRMVGLADLDPYLSDPEVDEVLVTDDRVWVDRRGRLVDVGRLGPGDVDRLIERILAPTGRRIDTASPIVDARLPDGSRVCAVVPPVSVGGTSLSIRRFRSTVRDISEFTDGTGATLLSDLVRRRCNVMVTGATSSGKTSLLATVLAEVDPTERILVIEDTTELPCEAPHLVRLEARPADAEGSRPITLDDLLRTALRLRPDRLVVGEVRGHEVLALVQAMNTGHDGSFSTCHANGPLDALLRIESLVLQAAPRWPLDAIRSQLHRSIDAIVHVGRDRATGRRLVESVCEVTSAPVDPTGSTDGRTVPLLARIDGRWELLGDPTRGRV